MPPKTKECQLVVQIRTQQKWAIIPRKWEVSLVEGKVNIEHEAGVYVSNIEKVESRNLSPQKTTDRMTNQDKVSM
jgi:hypothetical protein